MGQTCEGCCSDNGTPQTDTMKRGHKERDGNGYRKESLSTSINDETDFATDDDYPPTEEASTTYDPHYTDGDHSLSYEQSLDTKSTEEIIFGFKKAVESGNDSLVMSLVEEYPSIDLLDYTFENGDNALHVAVRNKAYNLILYLITNGISPNEQNEVTLDTPLHTAVKIRDVNIVALLSKYKADPTISDKNYLTPLQIAIESKYEDIIELLSPETQSLVVENLQTYHGATNDVVDTILNDDTMFDDDIFPGGNDKDHYEVKLSDKHKDKRLSMKKPFSGIKRVKTQVALAAIHDITSEKNKLPTLAAWLEKKQDHMPYQWQKRWAIVKDSHILWSEKQRSIKNPKDSKERKKFNNSINLLTISEIKPVTPSKSQRKFIIVVGRDGMKGTKRREYLWKCATKDDRDHWVRGLQSHINHLHSIQTFLRGKSVAI